MPAVQGACQFCILGSRLGWRFGDGVFTQLTNIKMADVYAGMSMFWVETALDGETRQTKLNCGD